MILFVVFIAFDYYSKADCLENKAPMKRPNIDLLMLISALCSSSQADNWHPTVENFVLDSEIILYENSEKEYLFATALQKKLQERTHKDFQING